MQEVTEVLLANFATWNLVASNLISVDVLQCLNRGQAPSQPVTRRKRGHQSRKSCMRIRG